MTRKTRTTITEYYICDGECGGELSNNYGMVSLKGKDYCADCVNLLKISREAKMAVEELGAYLGGTVSNVGPFPVLGFDAGNFTLVFSNDCGDFIGVLLDSTVHCAGS